MKPFASTVAALLLLLPLNSFADETDVDSYFLLKSVTYDQTSSATPTLNANSPTVGFYINMTSPGSVPPSPFITLPDSSTFSLTDYGNVWQDGIAYPDIASRDAAWPMGNYTFTVPTISGLAQTFTPVLAMQPTIYTVPTILNNSWVAGDLLVNYGDDVVINWNSNDAGGYQLILNGSLGSFIQLSGDASDLSATITSGLLLDGETYNAYLLLENSVNDSVQIPGVFGGSTSYSQTYFSIVPEPSTVDLALGGAALLSLAFRRKNN